MTPKGAWHRTHLGEALELQRGFDLPSQDRGTGPVPVVSSAGVSGRHDRAKVHPPGVVTGRYGTVGEVFFLTEPFWPLNTTLFVKDFKGNDPRFCFYLLRSLDFTAFMDKSGVPGVNRNHLHSIPVSIPSIGEQRVIGGALGSLDDMVDVNRQTGETLEEIARTLFQSWFVDFDPVRGSATVPEDIRRLFPDRLVDSPIGPVPEGWEVAPLGEHVEVMRGLSYTGAGLADEGMPLHNLNSIREGGGYKEDGIKHYVGEFRERDRVRPGDVIVANTEQGFGHLLIGYPAIVPKSFGDDGIYSQDLSRLRPLDGSPLTPRWLYLLLVGHRMHHQVAGYSNGTTVNHLAMDGLEKPLIAVPPRELVEHFDAIVAPMFDQQEALKAESKTLAALRDTLLPKLISGELRLNDPSAGPSGRTARQADRCPLDE